MMENLNQEQTAIPQSDLLESYVRSGGFLRKDCWLNAMHVRYNSRMDDIELVDTVSTSDGSRILGVRERYKHLSDIPYVGVWLKCDERGNVINERDQIVRED